MTSGFDGPSNSTEVSQGTNNESKPSEAQNKGASEFLRCLKGHWPASRRTYRHGSHQRGNRCTPEGWVEAVTIDGIAKNMGRARSTLYRRWRSKRHLVAYAVVGELGEHPAADTGTLRGDLLSAVTTLWRAFRGPLGHALAGLVADMAQDAALASSIRREVMVPRRRSMREAIERACARGEVRDDMNVELLLDMLTGPFYFRTLFRHASMSLKDTAQIVDYIVRLTRPTR